MDMCTSDKYKDIRPLLDAEVNGVFTQLLANSHVQAIIPHILPDEMVKALPQIKDEVDSINGFKEKISLPVMDQLIARTTFSLTASGMSKLSPEGAYTFISNHRDIVLDASFLSVLLYNYGKQFPQIAIGDNLLLAEWIEQLVKINNAFIVKRGVSIREFLAESKKLSEYIRYVITELKESVWIAQREGRAKDANDTTQVAMLKMLGMSSTDSLTETYKALNIVPLSISYEYDPCDYLKAKEMWAKHLNPDHKKRPEDDFENMKTGILGYKGRIHYAICDPLNDLSDMEQVHSKQAFLDMLAKRIDTAIHSKYRLYPSNYLAYDLRFRCQKHSSMYSAKEKATFEKYIRSRISLADVACDEESHFIQEKLLEMYSNPLINKLKIQDEK